ncbi:MAG: hypothetical protein IJA62_07735 [Ruminococcus sp.]|nr:hypothetical protein [Ruminococcus sp.]
MSENLKKGIAILYDMEMNNYLMTRAIEKLNYKISGLGYSQKINAPRKESGDYCTVTVGVAGGVIGAVLGLIIGLLSGCLSDSPFFIFDRMGEVIKNILKTMLICAVVGLVLGLIIGLFIDIFEGRAAKREYKESMREYYQQVNDDNNRVALEKQQVNYLVKQRDALKYKLSQSKQILNQFYNRMNIAANYRNLVPIGYMNEFIRLGIATKLEGTDGLYYLVRNELRADQFYHTLEEISGKLDVIIDQNNRMYAELINTNKKVDNLIRITENNARRMNDSFNRIETNTGIAAYNSQRSAEEARFQSFMLACHWM